jgi:hypothetical protein
MSPRLVAPLSCALAVAAIAGVRSQTAQQQPQRPVFRSGAIFVSVDAYPRKDDKVVEGLTKTDFEIFEDGKPQAVEAFEFIRVSPITPDDERRIRRPWPTAIVKPPIRTTASLSSISTFSTRRSPAPAMRGNPSSSS